MSDSRLEIVLAAKDITEKAFASVTTRAKRLVSTVTSIQGAVLGLAGVGGFGLLIEKSFDLNDKLAKTSDKLGITTEALSGMRHAAELTGVASNTLDMALQRMVRRVAEAAEGTGEAKGALVELGLDARKLAAMSPDKMFEAIAERMSHVSTQGDRVRLAFKLFDSEGVSLVNTLQLGSAGLREAAQEADALGLSISRVDAKGIEDANDAMTRIQGAAQGIVNTLAIALADPIADIANSTSDWVKANQGLIQQDIAGSINVIADAVGGLAAAYDKMAKMREFAYEYFPAAMVYRKGKEIYGKLESARYYMGLDKIDPNASTTAFRGMEMADYGGAKGYDFGKPAGGDGASADAMLSAMGLTQETKDKIDQALDGYIGQYRDYLSKIKQLNSDYLIARDQARGAYYFDPELARMEGGQGEEDYAKSLIERFDDTGNTLKDIAERTSYGMQGALSDFFNFTTDGFLKIETLALDVSNSIVGAFTNALAQKAVGTVGTETAAGTGLLGLLFGGFRAGGGDVYPGVSYVVGERGPELLTMGGRGYVTPNSAIGGRTGSQANGSGGDTYVYVTAWDSKSVEDMVNGKGAGPILKLVDRAISYNGRTRSTIKGSI